MHVVISELQWSDLTWTIQRSAPSFPTWSRLIFIESSTSPTKGTPQPQAYPLFSIAKFSIFCSERCLSRSPNADSQTLSRKAHTFGHEAQAYKPREAAFPAVKDTQLFNDTLVSFSLVGCPLKRSSPKKVSVINRSLKIQAPLPVSQRPPFGRLQQSSEQDIPSFGCLTIR